MELENEMVRKSNRTSIALNRSTKQELEEFREYRRESADEIIAKLMTIAKQHAAHCTDEELSQKLLLKLKDRLKEVNEGRVLSTKQLKEKLRKYHAN